ncbi:MAG: hypothetical protein A2W99_05910 [Bacteroidetes bacterium GWF2_33_16]|nr:MAG: hypothetical protein A2X00_12985 [Bacteroidetes bacterium GWE2_32_14]OFY05221.1 MAG: hypothetical protein A2W99_05910 [Bacteroidetes bacterium GWF2_33_16]
MSKSKFVLAFFFLSLFLLSQKTNAQYNYTTAGARSAAMANTSVTLNDFWSIYNNQAGLGYLQQITAGVFHRSGFISEQNSQGIGVAVPTKTGTLAATFDYYGFSAYNEIQAGLAFGRTFTEYFSAGVKLNYLHTQIAGEYGSASTVTFEIGILSQPINNLFVGVSVYNPSRSKMGSENIPTIYKAGIGYFFSDKALLAIETEKDLDQDAIFKAGIDYKLIDLVSLQAGISTNPSNYSFGVGLHHSDINLHVGFLKHQTFGFTPSFSLSYGF